MLVGRYRLCRELGRGATAEAWEAEDLFGGGRVALKWMHPDADPALLRREFEQLCRLVHPRIAEVHDFGVAEGRAYHTARLVRGRPLSPRSWHEATQALRDVVDALAFLHRRGLRHGDLKPANVLADDEGRATLVDLGCAARFGVATEISGTRRYLAPELLRGERADGRADLFALGVMLEDLAEELGPAPEDWRRLRLRGSLAERPSSAVEVLERLGERGSDALASAPRFVGREEELARFEAMLDAGRGAVALAGPSGSGRTRLLREMRWRAQLRGPTHAFAGSLRPTLEAMGLPTRPAALAEVAQGVFLVDKGDALEEDERRLVAALVTAPVVVVAAIDSLEGAERWSLGPLGPDDVGSLVDAELVAPLLERTGGWPGPLWRARTQVGDGGPGAVATVHLDARDVTSLDEELQRTLALLAAGGRPATVDPRLLRGGWVVRDEGGFRCAPVDLPAPLLRDAHARLARDAEGDDALYHRALAGEPIDAAPRRPGRRWREVADAQSDPRVAARFYEAAGASDRVVACLEPLDLGGDDTLRLGRALLKLERTADLLERIAPDTGGARDLRARARIKRGDYVAARDEARAALDDPGDCEGALHEDLGVASSYLGDHETAAVSLRRAAELAGDAPRARVRALSYLAIDAYRRGALEEAGAVYAEVLALAEDEGLDDQLGSAALNLGTVHHLRGEWGEALRSYARGVRAARALGQHATTVTLEFDLAKLYADLGSHGRARPHAERALAGARDAELAHLEGASLSVLGELALADGDLERATRCFADAFALFDRHGAQRERAEVAVLQLELAARRGDVEAALERARDLVGSELDVRAQLALAEARARLDEDPATARRVLEEHADADLPRGLRAAIHGALADAWRRLGGEASAQRHARRARELWERTAASLDPELRDVFWAHPDRAELRVPAVDSGRAPKLERLLAINRRLSSTLDTDEVLRMAMDSAVALAGAERGFLLLRSGDAFEVAIARNLDRERIRHGHAKFSRTIAEKVVETGDAILTIDARSDRRFRDNESVHAMKLRSVLALPIPSPDGVLGALYLDNRFQRGRFAESDVELLAAFADQLAIALRNAKLHADLRARSEELERERARVEELNRGQAQRIDALMETVRTQRASIERRHRYEHLVGDSAAMRQMLDVLDRVVDSPLSVLVQGESGTGKELVARAVHQQSGRSGTFVAINCGALPENLLESELFGHVRGAFTGADRDRVGLMEAAEGGTLFLDELGEMPPSLQVRLLRALESRRVRPVGGTTERDVDFRLVCATNRDLQAEVDAGRFRADLFYRVGVVQVRVPALRERLEDLPALCDHLMERIAGELDRPAPKIAPATMRVLFDEGWPGNVRQLLNVLRAAAVMAEDRIEPHHLSLPAPTLPVEPAARERARIRHALRDTGHNVSAAAKQLGIGRATLYRWMKKHDIPTPRAR